MTEDEADIAEAATPKNWATYQGSPAHTGFVRMWVNPRAIARVWEHTPNRLITRVAADQDRVYFSGYGGDGTADIRALDVNSGTEEWTYPLGQTAYVGDPAIEDGLVVVSSMVTSSSDNPITVLDAASGAFVRRMTFAAQWSNFLAPTIRDGRVYSAAGYYGNLIYGHELGTGALLWNGYGSGYNVWNGEALAVGAECAYFYTGESLDCFGRTDGVRKWTIADPYNAWGGYTYDGAPIILKDGSVVAYSGTTGGGGYFEAGYRVHRPLVRYMPGPRSIAWKSADTYLTTPAVRGSFLYVARNNPSRLDGLDTRTGQIAWSWTPPPGETFHGNTVATSNVLFVSTNNNIYAVRLSDRSVVWSYDSPGLMAISPGGLLLISEATEGSVFGSNGRLSAFRLQ